MAKDLQLNVGFSAMDKLSPVLKKIKKRTAVLSDEMQQNKHTLDKLKTASGDVDKFRKLERSTEANTDAMREQQRKVRDLTDAIEQASGPTKRLTQRRDAAIRKVDQLRQKTEGQNDKLEELRRNLKEAAGGTENLGDYQENLKRQIKGVNEQLERQQKEFAEIAKRRRITREHREKLQGRLSQAQGVRQAGVGMATAGAVSAVPVVASVVQAVDFQAAQRDIAITASFSDKQEAALSRGVRASAKRWNATVTEINKGLNVLVANGVDNVKVLRKYANIIARTSTATQADTGDLATLIYSLQTNLGVAVKNTRATLNSLAFSGKQGSFELPDMAKWIPQLGPMMAALGAQGKQGAVQLASALQIARLGAGSNDEAANNLRNYLSKITAPVTRKNFADVGIDLQKRLLELQAQGVSPVIGSLKVIQEYLGRKAPDALEKFMSALKIKDQGKRAAALQNITDSFALGKIFQDQQAMAFIRPALANMDKLKQLQVDSMNAAGVIKGDWQRRMEIGKQQLKDFLISVEDLAITVGNKLMPVMIDILDAVGGVIDAITKWARENPKLADTVAKVVAGLSALLIAAGGLAVALGAMMVPFAFLEFGLKRTSSLAGRLAGGLDKIGINGKNLKRAVKGAGRGIKAMGKGALWLAKTVLPLVLGALRTVAVFMLTNPIGMAITGIATAAYLIYRYWEPISQFFKGLWQDVKAAFADGVGGVAKLLLNWSPLGLLYKGIMAAVKALGVEIPQKFASLGGMIIDGLIGGITAKFGELKQSIVGVASSVGGWFKDKMGINSPSRVFKEYGVNTVQGYRLGVISEQRGAVNDIGSFARKVRNAGAGLALGAVAATPALASPVAIDHRPPVARQAGGGDVHYNVSIGDIHAAPGMNEQQLAQYVANEVQRALASAKQDAAAARRSALYDTE